MPRIPVNPGDRFGDLIVISELPEHTHPNGKVTRMFRCKCVCGSPKRIDAMFTHLRSGHTRSCGCARNTHGMHCFPENKIWSAMKHRCLNPNDPRYHRYGGRGIKVCDRWLNSFEAFFEDMGPRPSKNHSIDRKDVNGNYCPDNCYWATAKEQARTKEILATRTFHGITAHSSDWYSCLLKHSVHLGLTEISILSRVNKGWSLEEILSVPLKVKRVALKKWIVSDAIFNALREMSAYRLRKADF